MADKTEQKDPIIQEAEPVAPEASEAAASSSVYPMDEVFLVNHLLQIEDLDWTQQLKQAVSNFLIFVVTPDFIIYFPMANVNSLPLRVSRIPV